MVVSGELNNGREARGPDGRQEVHEKCQRKVKRCNAL